MSILDLSKSVAGAMNDWFGGGTKEQAKNGDGRASVVGNAPVIDMVRFATKIKRDDMARPNLFMVAFGQFSPSLTGGAEALDVDNNFYSIREQLTSRANINQLMSMGNTYLSASSETYRTMQSAYSPELIRLAGAGDILDTITGADPDTDENRKRDLPLMVRAANIPSEALSFDMNHQIDHMKFVNITGRENGDFTLTFYCSPDYRERLHFTKWMAKAVNPITGKHGFHDDVVQDVVVYTYDRDSRRQTACLVRKAVPVNVGEVQLDYDLNNQVSVFTVTFAYSYCMHASIAEDKGNLLDMAKNMDIDGLRRAGRSIGTISENLF